MQPLKGQEPAPGTAQSHDGLFSRRKHFSQQVRDQDASLGRLRWNGDINAATTKRWIFLGNDARRAYYRSLWRANGFLARHILELVRNDHDLTDLLQIDLAQRLRQCHQAIETFF